MTNNTQQRTFKPLAVANITSWSELPVQAEVIADEWVMREFERRKKMLMENE